MEWHLSRRGASNLLLSDLLHFVGISDRFLGVVPADDLDKLTLPLTTGHIVIVNVGLHFVTLCLDRDFVLYVDPFGQPIANPSVYHFIKRYYYDAAVPIYFNQKRIQHASSSHCALYAALFALHFDGRRGPNAPPLRFAPRHLWKNDARCLAYLKNIECLTNKRQ